MVGEAEDNAPREVTRRSVFKHIAAAGTAAVVAAFKPTPVEAKSHASQMSSATAAPLEALETLSAAEANTLEAIVARLIPRQTWKGRCCASPQAVL
jgi:hypothetical protein